jgi:hypothetical protein
MHCLTMASSWRANQLKRGFYYCTGSNVALKPSAFVMQSLRLPAALTGRSRESQ